MRADNARSSSSSSSWSQASGVQGRLPRVSGSEDSGMSGGGVRICCIGKADQTCMTRAAWGLTFSAYCLIRLILFFFLCTQQQRSAHAQRFAA